MKTILYNTDTQEFEGAIRQGRYKVDGKIPTLPNNIVELTIVNEPTPPYDNKTQKIISEEIIDLDNKEWRKTKTVVDKTSAEIEEERQKILVNHPLKTYKVKIALANHGLLDTVNNITGQVTPLAKILWEESDMVIRNCKETNELREAAGISPEQLDDIFIEAAHMTGV